ncbi:virulence factor TspB C-terminal domain-related protein [Diaphorobacter sp. ED-3]|uniref:virulence factor TspB C-terminal domain-related protein n=1 Tax=Diaphorobacter sp. ED-3 TaxID=3016636 RepID=UPI0022DD4836|nr:virulence factor TspB C-terminal domain-related protein [Diaphorobacter sp. ED-3]
MAYLRALVAVLLAAFSLTAHAGYAQLAPPPGFSGGAGAFGYAAAANDQVFGRVIHQSGALTANVGGQAVRMPAAYRLAANAPRIAAQAIFLHPGIRTAAGIALWLGAGKLVWDASGGMWREVGDQISTDGFEYAAAIDPLNRWFPNPDGACARAIAVYQENAAAGTSFSIVGCNASHVTFIATYVCGTGGRTCTADPDSTSLIKRAATATQCPSGWTFSPAGCLSPAVQQPRFEELLNPANQPGWPMPDSVPLELPPGTPLPVEQPFINPEPGPNPAHRPQFVPTGNPVPNPKYDPNSPVGPANQPYLQPGVRIVPSPTPSNPWQVDMQPVDRPVGSADPNPQPQPDPEPGDGDRPKPEEQQSLCEKHPDIVACQKLGDVQPEALASKTVPVSIQREDGFGPADGACPAPKEFVILGKQMAFRWDLICDFASGIRPLLVGFAYLSAALAFLGLSRKEV